ncbi:LOW QUALITY PROTEIN: prosaposin [Procambarus clarkii]|uniref:LOW QUALITY PROTEIN: prosaposin n=1 Tax=Procambarus clarkii TaxID=6728 RepID=UPI0037438BAC
MRALRVLLAGLAVCVLSGESALLGTKKCTYGPGYWCDSLVNAKECSAVRHCIQTVWEKQRLPEDNDDICTICKNMVQEARDQLLSNETQEEIQEVLEGSCRLIPIKVVSDECVDLADEFIPELIETLASAMNPQVVCATAGLCNSIRIDRLLQQFQESQRTESNEIIPHKQVQHPQPGDCESCKDFVSRTIRLVKTHSRSELMDRLFAICGHLGSISDGCMALVETNFDDIYRFLTEQLTPNDFCDLVEMCEPRMHQSDFYQKPALPHSGDEPCDFCQAMVQHWRDILTSKTTEEEFKQILDGLCRQTGSFKQNCLSLVDEYYLPLYNLLVSEIHPKEICAAVGLCGATSVFAMEHPVWPLLDVRQPITVPQTPLTAAVRVASEPGYALAGADEAASINLEERVQEPHLPRVALSKASIDVVPVGTNGVIGAALGKGHVGDNKCVMCEFALHFLQNMLEQKDTRKDIEDAMEQLCEMMPRTIAEECEDYVEAYGEQVIELLAQKIDPSLICPMLHLCPGVTRSEVSSTRVDASCAMCEYALTTLEDYLKKNKTETDIRKALEELCSVLPTTVSEECRTFVDTYSEQIIQMLIDNLSPDQVCIKLGLCQPKELPKLDSTHQLPISRMFMVSNSIDKINKGAEAPKMGQSAVCVLCELTMMQLDQFLLRNATKNEIIEVVDFICAHIPGTLQDDCIGFVEEYGDAIIKLLVNEMNPKVVCQQIKLCKPPSFTGLRAMANLQLDKCQVCKGVVSYVDEKLKDGEATTTIDTILEEVCRLFPQNTKEQCRNIVEVYGPYLVNLLAELGNPEKVCQEIELCPNNSPVRLLGGDKCTWGPSYWCQTQMHAAACKATVHCQTKVWKRVVPQI